MCQFTTGTVTANLVSRRIYPELYVLELSANSFVHPISSCSKYSLLFQTLDYMSPLDTAVLVLFTSFVGHLPTIPTLKNFSLDIDYLSMFSPPGAPVQASPSCPARSCPCPPLYPDISPRSMALRCPPACVCGLWNCCDIIHAHIPPVTLSPTRKVPRTSNGQNIEALGSISQRHGRHA
jgi:hypothetical protein